MREQDIQRAIIDALNTVGCRVWRTNAGKIQKDGYFIQALPAGYPDISGFRKRDGKAVFIEVKTATGKLRPAQKEFANEIQHYNVLYGVARSVEDAIAIVNSGERNEEHGTHINRPRF
ncbi:VRR-NUC domain-containing protein [Schleiferilactobacillus shenzhenensis]|uniref:VRR-NUC domain-containing protein n=1 Tax=Schleiferilactobacillus shenzhenensis TaxID=1231337 RepID=UPI000691F2FB|nr:VRR-NUC domain-containing protein [Schleiferilactobacillus shenzhenensis]